MSDLMQLTHLTRGFVGDPADDALDALHPDLQLHRGGVDGGAIGLLLGHSNQSSSLEPWSLAALLTSLASRCALLLSSRVADSDFSGLSDLSPANARKR